MCATPLAPTGGTTLGQVPSRSRSSAERLTRPEWCALSSLPFYTAARGTRGWLPTVLHSQNEECICVCVSACVWVWVCVAGVSEVPLACVLWAFSCFLLWSSLSSLHPTRSLRLRLLVCTPTEEQERDGRGTWGCLSHRHYLFCQYRERCRESCPWGTATGCKVQWVEGSPGAKVMHTVQFSAPLLCSLRSSNSGLKFLCEKQLPQSLEGGLLTPYNMGKCTPQLVVI